MRPTKSLSINVSSFSPSSPRCPPFQHLVWCSQSIASNRTTNHFLQMKTTKKMKHSNGKLSTVDAVNFGPACQIQKLSTKHATRATNGASSEELSSIPEATNVKRMNRLREHPHGCGNNKNLLASDRQFRQSENYQRSQSFTKSNKTRKI